MPEGVLSPAIWGCHGALGDLFRPGLAQRLECVCVLALVSGVACLCLSGWDRSWGAASPTLGIPQCLSV